MTDSYLQKTFCNPFLLQLVSKLKIWGAPNGDLYYVRFKLKQIIYLGIIHIFHRVYFVTKCNILWRIVINSCLRELSDIPFEPSQHATVFKLVLVDRVQTKCVYKNVTNIIHDIKTWNKNNPVIFIHIDWAYALKIIHWSGSYNIRNLGILLQ